MRRLGFAALAACSPGSAARVEIVAPLPRVAPPVAALEVAMPREAAAIRSSASGEWARAFPAEKAFREWDLPRGARVLLTWRMGREHAVRDLASGEDYPANHVLPLELVLRAAGAVVTVPLGELPGAPSPTAVTYCRNRGYHVDSDGGWSLPKEPSVASSFDLAIMSGSDDFLVVRDGGTLHLLHRETSDGRCDETKQGPLDVCEGSEWSRAADLDVGGGALYESIEDGEAPFDCAAEVLGRAARLSVRVV